MTGTAAMAASETTLTMAPLEHPVGAEEVDGEVLFDHGRIAEIVGEYHPGVVDQNVQRLHALDSRSNLCRIGHIQGHRRDAPIRMGQGLPGTGVDASRAPAQGFLHQRLPNTAIAAGHQKRFICDCHTFSS
jgi:hypothetical protein